MKQITAIVLAMVLAFSLCACGCMRQPEQTPTENTGTRPEVTPPVTTQPATTAPTTMPDMIEPETNIPDPEVDPNSTGNDNGIIGGDQNGANGTDNMTGANGDMSRSRTRRKP